jgi:hypothetical protein
VPIGADGKPGELRSLWQSGFGGLPDGFAIARSGQVYIAEVGLSAHLVQVAPDGKEVERFPRAPGTGENGSPVPFDSPSSTAFLGTRLIVANQSAVAGNAEHQVLLDVEAAEPGLPEVIPANAGPRFALLGLTGRVVRARGRVRVIELSREVEGARRVRVTAHGRTVGTGTLRGRRLRLVLRRRRPHHPGAVTLRGGRLAPTRLTIAPR